MVSVEHQTTNDETRKGSNSLGALSLFLSFCLALLLSLSVSLSLSLPLDFVTLVHIFPKTTSVIKPAAVSPRRFLKVDRLSTFVSLKAALPDQLAKVLRRNAVGPLQDLADDVDKIHILMR